MINNRVTKWIEHIVRSEWRSVAEERSDNIDKMHFPKDGVEKIEIN
jgi:hypothetical protein